MAKRTGTILETNTKMAHAIKAIKMTPWAPRGGAHEEKEE